MLVPVKRFFLLLRPDRKEIGYIYLYALLSGILTLSLPLGVQAVIGLIQGGEVSSSLVILISVVTLGTLFTGLLKVMQLTVAEGLQRRIFARSSLEFAMRIPRLRMDALDGAYAPELTNRFFDTLTIQKSLPKVLMDFSTAALQIVFGLLLISFYHPFFVFFGITILALLALVLRWTGPRGLVTSLQESKYKYKVAHWLQEVARTMGTFKLAGPSQLPLKRTNTYVQGYLEARGAHFRILMSQYGVIVAFKVVVTAVLLALGGILVIRNQISIGQFVAAEIVVILILNSVEKLILTLADVYDLLTGLDKMGYFTDLPLDPESGMSFEKTDTGKGMALSVRNLSYTFKENDRETLSGISFDIAPGEKVCLAGFNGAGKSTLIQVISSLIVDYQGTVSYNGVPAMNFNLMSLRKWIADHGEQEDLFEGTVLDNVCLGHEDVDFQRVQWAIQQVGLEAYVQSLPEGYQTHLVPNGRNIPNSVRIKLLLARCIASNPRLLAMEEFLSKLEASERQRMVSLLTDKSNGWTLLAVSNSPLMAQHCDRVILMKDGQVVAQGSYEELKNTTEFKQIFSLS